MSDSGEIPHHFLCPISLEIMTDPVTVSSGHTFDRSSISGWLSTGNTTCPVTRSTLTVDLIIPNLTLRRLIKHWMRRQKRSLMVSILSEITRILTSNMPSSEPGSEELRTESLALLTILGLSDEGSDSVASDTGRVELSLLRFLLHRASSSSIIETRVVALSRLSRLVYDESKRSLLMSILPETTRVLSSILFSSKSGSTGSEELRHESLALLAKLGLSHEGCDSVASDASRIGFLIRLMREPNNIDVRSNATVLVKTVLSGATSPELKSRVATAKGVVAAVVAVVKSGMFFRRAMKVGVEALFELCLEKENQEHAVAAGAADALVDVVARSVDLKGGEAEAVLATTELLCRVSLGCTIFAANPEMVPVLVRMMIKVSESATEHVVGILVLVCEVSERWRREAAAAGVVPRLLMVVQTGETVTKRKAVAMLKLLQDWVPVDSIVVSGA